MQLSGFGYKQSGFGSLHLVLCISWLGHIKLEGGVVCATFGVFVVIVEAEVVEVGVVEAEKFEAGVVEARIVVDDDNCIGDGLGVVLLGQVDCDGQSHIFFLSFHSRPAEHCITTGLPLPPG